MAGQNGETEFREQVFPAELEEILKRRERLDPQAAPLHGGPSTRLGLTGLALSGGGIRSATFSLGVIQALAEHDVLKRVDYLSTVSGGGYMGACLSSALNSNKTGPDKTRFPLHCELGQPETPAVGHLRDSSNYLAPGGFLEKLKLPALALRGVLSNLLVFLLIILLAVLFTEVIYETGQRAGLALHVSALWAVVLFGALVVGFPFVSFLLRHHSSWHGRNLGEMAFAVVLLVVLCLLALVPVFMLTDQAIDHSWEQLRVRLLSNLMHPFEIRNHPQWLLAVVALAAFMLAGSASERVSKLRGKLVLFSLGLLGPVVLILIYLGLVVLELDSPFVTAEELFGLRPESIQALNKNNLTEDIREQFQSHNALLSGSARAFTVQRDTRWIVHDTDRAYSIVREEGELGVYPDFLDVLRRRALSPELLKALNAKDLVTPLEVPEQCRTVCLQPSENGDTIGLCDSETEPNERRSNPYVTTANYRDFEINGLHCYLLRLTHDKTKLQDPNSGVWSMEQYLDATRAVQVLQAAGRSTPLSRGSGQRLLHRGLKIAPAQLNGAVRYLGEKELHDVMLVVANKPPPFEDEAAKDSFSDAFKQAIKDRVGALIPEVRVGLIWFDDRVHFASPLMAMNDEGRTMLLDALEGRTDGSVLDFASPGAGSAGVAALVRAVDELELRGRDEANKSILFVGDGFILGDKTDVEGMVEYVKNQLPIHARKASIRIYGIALSTQANFPLFNAFERHTGGDYLTLYDQGQWTPDRVERALKEVGAAMAQDGSSGPRGISFGAEVRGSSLRPEYQLARQGTGVLVRVALDGEASDCLARISHHPPAAAHDLPASTALHSGPGREGNPGCEREVRELLLDLGLRPSAGLRVQSLPKSSLGQGDKSTEEGSGEKTWTITDPFRYTITSVGPRLKVTQRSVDDVEQQESLKRFFATYAPDLWDGQAEWLFFGALFILFLYWMVLNVNITAAHRFYRDRLSKAYLFRAPPGGRLEPNDAQKLSGLNSEGAAAPYHIINVALNLQGEEDRSLRGRKSDFFVFTKRYTGSLRTGFVPTAQLEKCDRCLDLGTAMAISGAAAAPNMGTTTLRPLVFIMTLLNIRLGYWLPNPSIVRRASWLQGILLRRGAGPTYLIKEALGRLHGQGSFVNVSDGGHIENLALYELLRRRCRFIIAVDGEADLHMRFGGLVTLMLFARIDLGIRIDIDLDPIRLQDDSRLSNRHWAVGTVHYGSGEVGHLLYIKSSMTGDEYEYVREYRAREPEFPHESTANQFFNEKQFEAYRALGYHIADELFSDEVFLKEPLLRDFYALRPAAGQKSMGT